MDTFCNGRGRKKEINSKKKKKEINTRLVKGRIIRNNRALFEQEEDYYKPKTVSNF